MRWIIQGPANVETRVGIPRCSSARWLAGNISSAHDSGSRAAAQQCTCLPAAITLVLMSAGKPVKLVTSLLLVRMCALNVVGEAGDRPSC